MPSVDDGKWSTIPLIRPDTATKAKRIPPSLKYQAVTRSRGEGLCCFTSAFAEEVVVAIMSVLLFNAPSSAANESNRGAHLYARLPPAADDRDDADAVGCAGRCTSNVSARPSLCPCTTSVVTDGSGTGGGAVPIPRGVAEQAHATRASSTTSERRRVLLMADGQLRSRPAALLRARPSPAPP